MCCSGQTAPIHPGESRRDWASSYSAWRSALPRSWRSVDPSASLPLIAAWCDGVPTPSIRHPIYASYLFLQFGYLLQSISVWNGLVMLLVTSCNVRPGTGRGPSACHERALRRLSHSGPMAVGPWPLVARYWNEPYGWVMALPPPAADRTAVITGASSGIGAAIARELARRGHGVTLVARRADKLESLAAELRAKGVQAHVLVADLSDREARARLLDRTAELGLAPEILVNNAGFTTVGPVTKSDPLAEINMIEVDVVAVADLCSRFLHRRWSRGVGVPSLMSLLPAHSNRCRARLPTVRRKRSSCPTRRA